MGVGGLKLISSWFGRVGTWLRPYRDALLYLMYSACFTLLPTLSAAAALWLFGRWTGDWAHLLASGNLFTASATLMASAVYVLRSGENAGGFLNSAFSLVAGIVIAWACLFYGALVLVNQGIVPNATPPAPKAIIISSLALYLVALSVTYRCLVIQHKKLPTNLEVRKEQVDELESQVKELEEQ